MPVITPPQTEQVLLERASDVAGMRLADVASMLGWSVPEKQLHAKGWIGSLIEACLGATAKAKPVPDFEQIGVELKTIPIVDNKPKETTYICSIPLLSIHKETWARSRVYHKLARVLWVPIEADNSIPLLARRVGQAILWSPNQDELAVLQQDWEHLVAFIALGRLHEINASLGEALHIRPKAAHRKSLCWAIGEAGEKIQTLPRGFYLRTQFTQQLIEKYYRFTK